MNRRRNDEAVAALVCDAPMIAGLEIMAALRLSWGAAWRSLRRLERAGRVELVVVDEGDLFARKRYRPRCCAWDPDNPT